MESAAIIDRVSAGSLLAAPAALLALAMISLGCAAIRAPLTCPERGGSAWTELTSRHFVLQTDVASDEARATLTRFETLRAALADVLPPPPIEPSDRIEIVLFDRTKDFYELTGRSRNMNAYFAAHLAADLEAQPVLVLHDDLADEGRVTFLHELAHRFIAQRFSDAPPWLNEGLAQLYSTLRIQDGKVTVGGSLPDADFSERPFFWMSWYENGAQLQIPTSKAPTVRELLEADRSTFSLTAGDEAPSNAASERQTVFYAAAWKLVQLLMNGPDQGSRVRFQRFLAAIERGARAKQAFQAAFPDSDMPALEALFHAYLTEVRLSRAVTDYRSPSPTPPEQERVMPDAEVHLLWARLRPWSKGALGVVERELDEVAARDPASPEVHFRRAVVRLRQAKLEAARHELDLALTARPDEPRYLLGRLAWFWARGGEASAVDQEEAAAIVERLAHFARSPAQLNDVAWFYATHRRPSDGFAFAERALRLDPTCWRCQDTYATVLFEVGRIDEALAANARALALVPETEKAPQLTNHRREIEKFKAAPPATAATCPETCTGSLTQPLMAALQRRSQDSRECYNRLLRTREAAGSMTVSLKLSSSGAACSASIVTPTPVTSELAPIEPCVRALFEGNTFPPPEGGCIVVHIPLTFAIKDDSAGASPR